MTDSDNRADDWVAASGYHRLGEIERQHLVARHGVGERRRRGMLKILLAVAGCLVLLGWMLTALAPR